MGKERKDMVREIGCGFVLGTCVTSCRAWSFLVPGFVMIVMGMVIFFFLIIGTLVLCSNSAD